MEDEGDITSLTLIMNTSKLLLKRLKKTDPMEGFNPT